MSVVAVGDPRVEIDSSSSLSTNGAWSADLSATMSPFGTLAQSGWRGRVSALASGYEYRAGPSNEKVTGRELGADLLAGYAFVQDGYSISLYAGPAVRETILSGATENSIGSRVGLRTVFGIYGRPTSDIMFSTQLRYTTLLNASHAETAAGWAVFGNYFLGPEISFLRSDTYRSFRVGAHLSNYRFGNIQAGVKGGLSWNKENAIGAYLGLGFYSGF
jgi:hypothetical protein